MGSWVVRSWTRVQPFGCEAGKGFHAALVFSLVKVMSPSHGSAPEISASWLITPKNQILQLNQVSNTSQNTDDSVHKDIAVLMK